MLLELFDSLITFRARYQRHEDLLALADMLVLDATNPRAFAGVLRRLRTDHLDLDWMHAWDLVTPVEEVLQSLGDLVRAGKIEQVGKNIAAPAGAVVIDATGSQSSCACASTCSGATMRLKKPQRSPSSAVMKRPV